MSKKNFIDSVEVKDPCSEDWNAMTGTDTIRFCSHCSKNVNNLSEMTRKEAMRLVRASNGDLCIRYIQDPVTRRPMFADQLLQITRRAPSVAAGVMSASIVLSTHAYAQENSPEPSTPPVMERSKEVIEKKSDTQEPANLVRITGTVVDPNKALIVGASINIFSVDAVKTASTTSNANGEYFFSDLKPGTYRIETTSPGFKLNSRTIVVGAPVEAVADTSLEVGEFEVSVEVKADVQLDVGSIGGVMVAVEFTSPLSQAVADEDVEAVRDLLAKGAKVNLREDSYSRITPLFVAVETGNVEITQILLDHGAKINSTETEKQTPIMRLDSDATLELVDLLIRYGAKVNQTDKEGNTALIMTASSVKPEVLKALIDAGADVRLANKDGRTALMETASNGDIESVKLLLESGSGVNAKNKDGETAWDLTSDDEIKKLLVSYGAEVHIDQEEAHSPETTPTP